MKSYIALRINYSGRVEKIKVELGRGPCLEGFPCFQEALFEINNFVREKLSLKLLCSGCENAKALKRQKCKGVKYNG